jgi:hypothetical protein
MERETRSGRTMTRITAGELTVGMKVAERDGYLLDVLAIVRETPKTVTIRLGSESSSTMRQPVELTVRKAAKVDVG